MDLDNMAQPLESVIAQEKMAVYPMPLRLQDRAELFKKW